VLDTQPDGERSIEPSIATLLERPLDDGGAVLEIVDAAHEVTEDGRMVVRGGVTNSGDRQASHTKIRISLTDASGELVDSTEVFVTPGRLGRGERGSFEASFPDPRRNVRIVLELNWIS
jgi:hypothetical protein